MIHAAKKALFGVVRHARAQQIHDTQLLFKLFDALVLPILMYGSQVWGVYADLVAAADRMHLKFLKAVLRVPGSTDTLVLLRELGRKSMFDVMLERQWAYWCRLQNVHKDRLIAIAMKEEQSWLSCGHCSTWAG